MSKPFSVFPDLLTLSKQSIERALVACAGVLVAQENCRLADCSAEVPCLGAVDATCGNGHDSLFLASTLQHAAGAALPWQLVAFDIQPAAVAATSERLRAHGFAERVSVQAVGHEHAARSLLPSLFLGAVMYNLGYLPGSDKSVITGSASTLASLQSLTARLMPGGLISVHTYGGHPGGLAEMLAVEAWLGELPFSNWRVARYGLSNKKINQEVLFLLHKLGD